MYTQEEDRSARLAREKAMYRYTTALETGDIDAIASLWHQAEHDAALERKLLETQAIYMNEDVKATAIDKELAAEILETVLLTPVPVQEGTGYGNGRNGPGRLSGHRPPPLRRVSRVSALAQSLAAVLVVGLIISGFLVLFASRHARTVSTGANTINWRVVASPNGQQSYNALYGVAALSDDDVWAVGATADQSVDQYLTKLPKGTQALIEHWNGSQWQIVPSPTIGTQGNLLFGVATISSNNIWAIGQYANSNNPTRNKTLIEHWDGKQWSIVASPNPGPMGNELSAISVVSPDDIWVVGTLVEENAQQHTLIEHWNGNLWQTISSPNSQPDYDTLSSVTAISASNVWAVGQAIVRAGKTWKFQNLIEHWNGSQWSIVSSPNPGKYGNSFASVAALSSDNIWAVGDAAYTSYTSKIKTFVEHWDGKQWSVVPSPSAGNIYDMLLTVTAIAANNIWATGWTATHPNPNPNLSTWQPLIEHWDGTQWHIVASPLAGISRYVQGMTWVAGTNHLWAVGGTILSQNNGPTLTELGTF